MRRSKKEVRAGHALARVRRLAALAEPARTAKLVAFAKRACRGSLIAIVNGLHVDRFFARKPHEPALPTGVTPQWALDLPLEFFGTIAKRLWPAQFITPRTKAPKSTTTWTLGEFLDVLARRRIEGFSLWNDEDVAARRPDSQRRGAHRGGGLGGDQRHFREQDGRAEQPSEKTIRWGRTATLGELLDGTSPLADTRQSDQELVHEFIVTHVGKFNDWRQPDKMAEPK